MRRYYMELPDSEYTTIQTAYDYIKRTYPHLTDGFDIDRNIDNFICCYPTPVFTWWDGIPFLGWGVKGGTQVLFPDVNCIVLGDIEYEESCL